MAIIPSSAIIRALSLFHLTLSYFLITSSSSIANQSLIFILGASMELVRSPISLLRFPSVFLHCSLGLKNITISGFICPSINLYYPFPKPTPPSFSVASPSTALAALILALLGLVDLTACSLPEEIGSLYWGSQAPIRCTFFFMLTGYAYAFKPEGPITGNSNKPSPWDNLHNSIVFTWGFLEMISWFWVSIFCPLMG